MGKEGFLAVILMLPAVDMDLRTAKVENSWILCSAVLMAAMKIAGCGTKALPAMALGSAVPVILLWPLFRIRALGAADCKLLSALGLLLGPEAVFRCMLRTFLIGGLLAGALMASNGTAKERFRYLKQYAEKGFCTGQWPPYRRKEFRAENLHMTVPLLLAVLLWAGGL